MTKMILATISSLLLTVQVGKSAPPENADPKLAPWFQSLQANDGRGCCSIADCRPVDSRITPSGYQAYFDHQWWDVPDSIILRKNNPVGRAVLCRQGTVMHCFVPNEET